MTQLYRTVLFACFTLLAPCSLLAVPQSPSPQNSELTTADQLYRTRRFAEAAARYQAIVKADPTLITPQANLVHCLLLMQKIDEAQAAAVKALAVQPNSAVLVTALGDVQFRLAEMPEAERSYLKAQTLDPRDPTPGLGLARIYRAYSLYRRAYDQLKHAHEIAPDDPVVERLWLAVLPPHERVGALEAYLANSRVQDPELRGYLAFLKSTANQPTHACRLVSKVEQTNTKLEPIRTNNARLGGSGLTVKLNGRSNRLVLDTGTSGIVVRPRTADKSALTRISEERIGGLGDTGSQTGYIAVADRIRVGDLEFQDCLVHVTDSAGPPDQDGLIGTDVFAAYLIDLDIPGQKLRLSPLPKRPDETAAPAALNSVGEAGGVAEDNPAESTPGSPNAARQPSRAAAPWLPKDAYVAPDMARWAKVFRFGHMLLIPTLVDGSRPMMFMIDTGAFTNILSVRAGREVTKVRADSALHVKGMSGSVANVYRADKATLQFGHYYQQNQNIVTLDLSQVSQSAGTEVSGILGFELLRILQIKIDYRDGLVDFIYDPNHLPKELRIKSN